MVRDDLAIRNEESMISSVLADAASKRGEDGPAAREIAETPDAVGKNPILRFGANAMSAFDGLPVL